MFKVDCKAPCPSFPPPNYVGQALFPYALDNFQQWSVMAISRNENVLVTAKTGSGKTAVGLYMIKHCLSLGLRVFYTTPIKSLSNQKFAELQKEFGGEATVGIMTGDIKFCPDADIIVMTQEILRNRLFKLGTTTEACGLSSDLSLDNLGGVVIDEAHYFTDAERGHAWEESLILLPPAVQVVLLSATMSTPETFAEWLADVRAKPCTLVSTDYRVVPLVYALLDAHQNPVVFMDSRPGGDFKEKVYRDWLKSRTSAEKAAEDFKRDMAAAPVGEAKQAVAAAAKAGGGGEEGGGGKPKVFSFKHVLNTTIDMLLAKKLCPALFFVLSRKGCEQFADAVSRDLLTSSESASVAHIFEHHMHRHAATLNALDQFHTVRRLALKGVAYHHSGVLPLLKEMVEILFTRGLIKVLFATETFAVGLNMPTKTAVFVDVKKFDDSVGGRRVLRPAEFTQMAGRAGRRGIDTEGLVIYLPDRFPLSPAEMKTMTSAHMEPLSSQLLLSYDFILRVLQMNRVTFDVLLDRSYWARQQASLARGAERELAAVRAKRARLVQGPLAPEYRAGCEELAALEAALEGKVNAERKKPQQAVEKWKNGHAGPRWKEAVEAFKEDGRLAREEVGTEANLAGFTQSSDLRLAPCIRVLRELGFIKQPGEGAGGLAGGGGGGGEGGGGGGGGGESLAALTQADLTLKGVLATEISEGHALLMSSLYLSGILREASGKELVILLASMLEEKDGDEDKAPELRNVTGASDAVFAAFGFLKAEAQRGMSAEQLIGIPTNPAFCE